MKCPKQRNKDGDARQSEPICLVVRGSDEEIEGRAGLVPYAGVVASDHVKPIRSWAKIRIESLPPGSRFLPVRIAAFQPVPKVDFLRDSKAQPGIVDSHVARAGRKTNSALQGMPWPVREQLFHVHSRRHQVRSQQR